MSKHLLPLPPILTSSYIHAYIHHSTSCLFPYLPRSLHIYFHIPFPLHPLLPFLLGSHLPSYSIIHVNSLLYIYHNITNISIHNCFFSSHLSSSTLPKPICMILRSCSQARRHRHPGSNSSSIVLPLGALDRSTTAAASIHDGYLGPDSVPRL